MAKELPFFKFEPNQWENGNIQMLSREDKGLFIDLCSMYWSRLGDVPFKLAIQKLCNGNATAFDSLCDENIIELIDGNIYIDFLSEQLESFKDLSKTNSKNAKEGWEKRRKQKESEKINAIASDPQCESDAIREDKIKEDKRKEEVKAKKEFLPPSIDEVIKYFDENNFSQIAARKAYEYYNIANWKDSTGKQVKNWKQKMISVWFKPENKKQISTYNPNR